MFGTKKRKQARIGLAVEALEDRAVPAVIAAADTYQVQAGQVLTVAAIPNGVLANDFSNTDPNAILAASITQGAQYANENVPPNYAPALPAGTLTFTANGAFTITAPSNYQTAYGPITFKYRAIDTLTGDQSTDTTVTINVLATTQTQKFYATGSGPGVAPDVKVYVAGTGLLKYELHPFEASFTGGVHVATGDLTGDGVDDIVVAPAVGGGPRVQVYDGATGILLEDFFAISDPNFRGGAYVAIGNIDGTITNPATGASITRNDLIVGAGIGGGPRVEVFDGSKINTVPMGTGGTSTFSTSILADFFAYNSDFRGGVEVAAGNILGLTDNNARDFIVTSPGYGGAPLVRVFDGRTVDTGSTFVDAETGDPFPNSYLSFYAGSVNDRNGISVAVGQFRGDNEADIVVGAGAGSPVVTVYDGRSGNELRSFIVTGAQEPSGGIAGDQNTNASGTVTNFGGSATGGGLVTGSLSTAQSNGGVNVAVIDRNGDGLSDIVTAIGPGGSPTVRIYDGNSLTLLDSFTAYPSTFLGGVFVGGNSLLTT